MRDTVLPAAHIEPTFAELERVFMLKYLDDQELGRGPSMRRRFRYFNPDDVYETIIDKFVDTETMWMDIGCGRNLFPSNHALARELSERSKLLVGLDPDATIEENPFVHEKVRSTIEDYTEEREFDLITLRMVAEHVTRPQTLLAALARLTRPNGRVVIYTVNKWTPASIISLLTPMRVHHVAKKILWGTEEKDTFPVAYKMNTRKRLKTLFEGSGFREEYFRHLDDCRVFSGFGVLNYLELTLQRVCRVMHIRYPETCLLGIYRMN